jgi:hypothetical protein
MKQTTLRAGLLALALSFPMNAWTALLKFQSSETQAALLELYTSEGCSSCPPAEAWLSRLVDSPRLWKDFVPVAFHVDYWDYLGWRDPWGSARFSDRQRAFAALWHSHDIYTPETVLNGTEWRDWSRQNDGPPSPGVNAGILAVVSPDTNHWQATFIPASGRTADYELHVALLVGGAGSEIKAGENRGRLLRHDFVALTLVDTPLAWSVDKAVCQFALPVPQTSAGTTLAIAAWLTLKGQLEPLQATGGWLLQPVSGH